VLFALILFVTRIVTLCRWRSQVTNKTKGNDAIEHEDPGMHLPHVSPEVRHLGMDVGPQVVETLVDIIEVLSRALGANFTLVFSNKHFRHDA
jgi:hypothetical protein